MIVCVGSAIVDCIVRGFDPDPISAAGFFSESADLSPGGDAVNQAVCLQKLGKNARIVCFTGHDAAGKLLTDHLEHHGVDTSCILHPDGAQTPVTVIFLDEHGQRKSITNRVHHFNFHPEQDMHWMDGAEAVALCSLFRAPFNDPDVVNAVVTEAKRRGLPVYADTKMPNSSVLTLSDLKNALPSIDCIFPNETEGAFYTGQTEPEAMADVFLSCGVGSVIVKLGEHGCLYKSPVETIRLPGLPVDAVDATGAGDHFAAGFMTLRSEGRSVKDALAFANAAGAVCTTAYGATAALKNRQQIQALLEERK